MKINKKHLPFIILGFITAVQIIFMIFIFCTQKTSHHQDEYYSYALANNYYKCLFYGDYVSDFKSNMLFTGDDFKYYLSTNKDTAFKYGSVWHNQEFDTHPPLYYAVLHTISSFFPDRFSWWWGFIINLVCFAATQVCLYLIFSKLSGSKAGGIVFCIFYGFTTASLNTHLYIRMYAMFTMWSVMYIYLSQRVFREEKLRIKQTLLPLAIVTCCGALTQHLFLVFAFFYTAVQCLYFLFRKQFKKTVGYGAAALIGVALSFAVFPPSVKHLFSSNDIWLGEADIFLQSHQLRRAILWETTGYKLSFFRDYTYIYILAALFWILLFLGAAAFLLRKNEKFKNGLSSFIDFLKKADYTLVFAVISSYVYVIFVAGNYYYFQVIDYQDKYIFNIMPVFCMFFVFVPFILISLIKNKKLKISGFCTIAVFFSYILISQNISNELIYAKSSNAANGSVKSSLKEQDCIVVLEDLICISCLSEALSEADDVYVISLSDERYNVLDEDYERILNSDSFCLVIYMMDIEDMNKENEENSPFQVLRNYKYTEKDILEEFSEMSSGTYKFCTSETIHDSDIKVYKFEKQH